MNIPIIKIEIRYEHDIVLARQRASTIAALLGFEKYDQVRIAAAVSEIARNAFVYADGGTIEFQVECDTHPQIYRIKIQDRGVGIKNLDDILEGRYKSASGMGMGIIGTRRLMDHFHIESIPGTGTTIIMGKDIPSDTNVVTKDVLATIVDKLSKQKPHDVLEEIQQQNQELMHTMDELHKKQEELVRLNKELDDTNHGVLVLYRELDDKAVALRKANELKTKFISTVSHELRTPINSIISLTGILLSRTDGELTHEQEKQVVFIRKAIESLSALVNDLLDMAKIEAGKVDIVPSQFEIANLFAATKGMMRPILDTKQVSLIFEDPQNMPALYTDESKVSQILRNFVSNAIKFTESGEIRVSVKLSDDGNAAVFSVADTGIGISPADQERIFQEYTQLDNPLQKKVKGTGLGLPISKKLAGLLKGSVSVGSTPGVGSVFYAVIPLVYSAPGETVSSPQGDTTLRPPPVIGGSAIKKILIIDNSDLFHYIFKQLLSGTQYTIISAFSGMEGIERSKAEHPDVIFLDLAMPVMSGFETLKYLKEDPETRKIPVIIVTSSVLNEKERNTLNLHPASILSKESLTQEIILSSISNALSKNGQGEASVQ